MLKDAGSLVVGPAVRIAVSAGTKIGILPLHRGHHAVWASATHQADVCNMVDDLVVRDHSTGLTYRFSIDNRLLPWLQGLIVAMNDYDNKSGSPWSAYNARVRGQLLSAACQRLQGTLRDELNVFEPGFVSPALVSDDGVTPVDQVLAEIIADRPNALVENEQPSS